MLDSVVYSYAPAVLGRCMRVVDSGMSSEEASRQPRRVHGGIREVWDWAGRLMRKDVFLALGWIQMLDRRIFKVSAK